MRRAAVPLVLGAGVAAYLLALPHTLGTSDEGLFLYESKMILAGRALYRDMFEIIPPGSFWLMAGLFGLFGPTIVTAKAFHAAIHSGIVAVLYAIARALGVRPSLAAATAVVHLALFEPAWGDASPHWLSTLLVLLVLRVLVRPTTVRTALLAGLLVGFLAWVQHQKAAVTAAGTGLFLLLEPLLVPGTTPLLARLAAFSGGIAAAGAPLVGLVVATAGVEPAFRALVEHPFRRYGPFHRTAWAAVAPFPGLGAYTSPLLLRYLPVLLAVSAVRTAVQVWTGARGPLRESVLLLVMALTAIGSIAYFPDVVHVGFIGPVFVPLLAVLMEAAFRRVETGHRLRAAPRVVVAALVLAVALRLAWRFETRTAECAYPTRTPFGTVALCDAANRSFVERMLELIEESGRRELFIYPAGAAYYLLTGTVNPTPVQILMPQYSFPEQFEEALAVLEQRRVPWVIAYPKIPGDPVLRYLDQHYRPVDGVAWGLQLYRRTS